MSASVHEHFQDSNLSIYIYEYVLVFLSGNQGLSVARGVPRVKFGVLQTVSKLQILFILLLLIILRHCILVKEIPDRGQPQFLNKSFYQVTYVIGKIFIKFIFCNRNNSTIQIKTFSNQKGRVNL